MTDAISDRSLWETHAGWWQEAFTDGADAEYIEQIIPMAARHLAGATSVLDVGTGEGQLARVAAAAGARVVGVDPSWGQLVEARRRAGGPLYVRGEAVALPFPDGAFDAALACLVFEHIEAVDAAIDEVARVLRPGGRFAFFLNHPLLQTPNSGWIDDHMVEPPEQYWRIGPYLVEDKSLEQVENGVFIPFIHRPLSRYSGRTWPDPGIGPATAGENARGSNGIAAGVDAAWVCTRPAAQLCAIASGSACRAGAAGKRGRGAGSGSPPQ